jgi:hypothetical protein
MISWLRNLGLLLPLLMPGLAFADPAPFDLAGPRLEVKVTHAGKTLPISEVPNLSVGDRLSVRANLPPGQSAHYLLVVVFLRGSTNPPPENWFFSSETWNDKDGDGLKVAIPNEAQQVLIFLAPETGGDFRTLVNTIRGLPGAFVRASQDLNQAILDRSRLNVYLAAIRRIEQADPEDLRAASALLARSLSIRIDPDCLEKMPELQAPCLMQGQNTLVLDDGHSTSMIEALTSGAAVDLALQLSDTPRADYGYYSPYVSSIIDIARIMGALHSARYQYIPALATEQIDYLSLELNTPPSFHNPKSVIVIALPAVEPVLLPPLHPVNPKEVYCAERTKLVLPVDGAPLVFSTDYAHDMFLRLKGKNGKFVDLPVKADAEKGGYVANTAGLSPTSFGDILVGSLHGYWGFEAYNGPEFRLENAHPQHWRLVDDDDQQSLIVGRDDVAHIETENTACVDSILLQKPTGETSKADWKPTGPNQVSVTVPLKKAKPGHLKLLVKQYGSKEPDAIPIQAFAQAGHLNSFTLHAGDPTGVLKGSRLDEVKELDLGAVRFTPGTLSSSRGNDELCLVTSDLQGDGMLKAGQAVTAKVLLTDGRILNLETTVEAPRPRVALIAKSIQPPPPSASSSKIQLANQDELPQDAQLTFSIHAEVPSAFMGDEKIEVAAIQGAFLTTLSLAKGLILEDSQVGVATLDTAKAFGPSASGPIHFRVIENGVASDWQPLVTLVRLPSFSDLKCPAAHDEPCKLTGSNLFLLDSVSNDSHFDHPVQVPEGFPGYVLSVPHPAAGVLYVKLHDDPSVINPISFPSESLRVHPSAAPVNSMKSTPQNPGLPAIGTPSSSPAGAQQETAPAPAPSPSLPPSRTSGLRVQPARASHHIAAAAGPFGFRMVLSAVFGKGERT